MICLFCNVNTAIADAQAPEGANDPTGNGIGQICQKYCLR